MTWTLRYVCGSGIVKGLGLTSEQLPLDVNEDVDDLEVLQQASENVTDYPVSPPSSLTTFIHFMRLRRIESKIEHVIYRVDRQTHTTPAIIQGFLDQLTSWKRAIPPEYHDQVDTRYEPYNGIDTFVSTSEIGPSLCLLTDHCR